MVREWVKQRRYKLERVCGIEISDTDFTDNRLAIVLRQLSQEPTWLAIEQNLSRDTYDVKANAVGRQRPKSQAEMIENLRSYLRSTQHQPTIVQNYFLEKHIAYAAT